jgi:hypothetical protein
LAGVEVAAMALPRRREIIDRYDFNQLRVVSDGGGKKIHSNFYIFREIRYTGFCPGERLYAA